MKLAYRKRRAFCIIFLILFLLSSVFVRFPRVHATASIFITPSAINDQSILPGSYIHINSSAANVADVFTWQVEIDFDPTVLRCVNASVPSNSIFKLDFSPDADINNATGTVVLGSSKLASPGVSGSDILATLTFWVVNRGYSRLNYSRPLGNGTYLLNSLQHDIPVTMQDCYFDNHIPGQQNWLTVQAAGLGTTDPSPGMYLHGAEENVSVRAIADSGYKLDRWELDSFDVGCAEPYVVNMSADHVLKAVFTVIRYDLAIQVSGSGTTNPSPGNHTYDQSTILTVEEFQGSGWVFDHWEYDGVNAGSGTSFMVIMSTNHVLRAIFSKLPCVQYSLSIDVSGSGTTNPSPGNLACDEGSTVLVAAVNSSDSVFDHWVLDGSEMVYFNPYSVTMNANRSLLAVFVAISSTPDNAIVNLSSKTVIGEACSANVTFTVQNRGLFTATWRSLVNVSILWNGTVIPLADGNTSVELELSRGETVTRTVVFTLNESDTIPGNYTLAACLSPVPFESNLSNNFVEFGLVRVSVVGDVVGLPGQNSVPDGIVDMRDIGAIAAAFGTTPSSASWKPNMDIDNDGCVTQFDIGIASQHFRERVRGSSA